MDVFLTKENIKKGIKKYVDDNKNYFIENKDKIVFCIVLKGGLQFFMMFYNILNIDIPYVFCKARSYSEAQKKSTIFTRFFFNKKEVKDKILIFIEDIYDSGHTANILVEKITEKYSFKELRFIFLIKRYKNKYVLNEEIKWNHIFDLKNSRWIIGFGMDLNNKYRILSGSFYYN